MSMSRPKLSEIVAAIVQENADGFVMVPEALEKIRLLFPEVEESDEELQDLLIKASGKAGVPIGLVWDD